MEIKRLILLFSLNFVNIWAIKSEICAPAAVVFRGTDLVKLSKGQHLLISFMPLQCSQCRKQIEKLSELAHSQHGVRIAVLAPHWETYGVISRLQAEFPKVLIDKDADSAWQRLGVEEHDVAVFDKCGRLARVISAPRSDLSTYQDTFDALNSARSHAICGWCSYGGSSAQSGATNARSSAANAQSPGHAQLVGGRSSRTQGSNVRRNTQGFQNVQVYMKPHTPEEMEALRVKEERERRRILSQRMSTANRSPAAQAGRETPMYGQPQSSNYNRQQTTNYNQPRPQDSNRPGSAYYLTTQNPRTVQPTAAQPWNSVNSASGNYATNYNTIRQPIPVPTTPWHSANTADSGQRQQTWASGSQNQPAGSFNNLQYSRSQTDSIGQLTQQRSRSASDSKAVSEVTTEAPRKLTNSLKKEEEKAVENQVTFGEEEYDYDLDDSRLVVTTQEPPQTQIPGPKLNPWWPSVPPTAALTAPIQAVGEENIPCSAYTDDICYHQQEKLGFEHISKCCTKKIYFTDLCIPGKCSNSTVQLCCMQKFLQARYACCNDENQNDENTPTDKFNRCCYDTFTVEDDCCPLKSAKSYWDSAHELCFPNTRIHLEGIRMEVRFSEGVRVVDLAENRLWDHACPNGANRVQFSYVP